MELPLLSVVIAARPGQLEIAAVESARRLDYPRDRLQILVARGRQPSVQRNAAIRQARGEWIYFLDDDSMPPPGNAQRLLLHRADPKVVVIGGPNLCPQEAPPLESAFGAVMANTLAFGPSAARYCATGVMRDSSEKELILCNLFARRDALMEAGGFDEALYPNEENALMDELLRKGYRLIYDPELWVYRLPRSTLRSFMRMVFTYGRGRAEQVRLHPTPGSLINCAPALFCVYLVALPWLPSWGIAGLGLYVLVVLWTLLPSARRRLKPDLTTVPAPPRVAWWKTAGLILLTHVGYGLGFWRGLFTGLKPVEHRTPVPVTVEEL